MFGFIFDLLLTVVSIVINATVYFLGLKLAVLLFATVIIYLSFIGIRRLSTF